MPDPSPALAALNARPAPDWYDAAKFGVFIHWGLFSIPGFAARLGSISDAFRRDYDRAVAMTPYTEWYANAIKVAGTPSAEFHRRTYGDAPYEAFQAPFEAGLERWDAAAWAEAFRDAGARYVVLVTKHHDGYCLWPSGVENPRRAGWKSRRDLVGELAAATRAAGMRFGVYYSGGLDWTFNPEPLRTLADLMGSTPGGPYPDYAEAQTRELIERYGPSVLWNDISWPTGEDRLAGLFADYYAAVPEGVVNDRWACPTPRAALLRSPDARREMDQRLKASMAANPAAFDGIIPPPVPHSDFRTPEYARFPESMDKKWEATRGMSHSFGYNRDDTDADYASVRTLLGDFIDGVAKNGNLLLNVGPMADGTIPAPQQDRLAAIGAWLRANGAAVYATRPWERAEGVTGDGTPVRFTAGGGRVNALVLGSPAGTALTLRDAPLATGARRLADGCPAILRREGPDLVLSFATPFDGRFAPVVALEASGG